MAAVGNFVGTLVPRENRTTWSMTNTSGSRTRTPCRWVLCWAKNGIRRCRPSQDSAGRTIRPNQEAGKRNGRFRDRRRIGLGTSAKPARKASGAGAKPNPQRPGGQGDPAGPKRDYRLFRFIDYTVEPGKQYRYRVKLTLQNPNRDVPINSLRNRPCRTRRRSKPLGASRRRWSPCPADTAFLPARP